MLNEERLFCTRPFEWLEIRQDRKRRMFVRPCCWTETFLQVYPLNQLASFNLLDFWNGEQMQALRQAIGRGEFSQCEHCTRYNSRCDPVLPPAQLTEPHLIAAAAEPFLTSPGPRSLHLSYDYSCNLACPSCRDHPIHLKTTDADYAILQQFTEQSIRPLLPHVEWLFVAGLGDPFGSRTYWSLLQSLRPEELPNLRIYLHTNGQGWTAENYQKLAIREQVRRTQISIDAACEETYYRNRGGDWQRLLRNLDYVAGLRRAGQLDEVHLSFVPQANNWRELPAFFALAERYGADLVLLYGLTGWDTATWSNAHFAERCVSVPGHPDFAEFSALVAQLQRETPLKVLVEWPWLPWKAYGLTRPGEAQGDAPCAS